MIKKKFAIIAIIAILVVAASASAISFATWDNTKSNTSVDFNTGENADIKVTDIATDEKNVLVPEGKHFMKSTEAIEVTAGSFKLSMVNYSGAKYEITSIKWYNGKTETPEDGKDASKFMQVTILDGSAPVTEKIGYLYSDRRYDVKIKFSVTSDSDLLTTEMANMNVVITINIVGVIINN